jgi:hypothetical protein
MTTDRQHRPSIRSSSHPAWVVAEATAVALVIWYVADLAGVGLKVHSGGSTRSVGAAEVMFVSLLVGIAGWGVLNVVQRRVARPIRTWRTIASVVLLLSFMGPLAEAVGTATTVALFALHLGTGSVLIAQLPRRP